MGQRPADILTHFLSHLRVPTFQRSKPGAPPGMLTDHPEAAPARVRLVGYGPDDHHEETLETLEDIPELLARWDVVWLDVEGVGDAELLARIGELFELPTLALEDVQNPAHRPKVEFFDERAHIILKMAHWRERLELEPISVFVGPGFVLTFQLADEFEDSFAAVRERIVAGRKAIRNKGVSYLGYAIIDRIVDSAYPVLEEVAETYYALESEVVEPATRNLLTRIHALNSQLLVYRRAVWPQREIIESLRRHPETVFGEELDPFLKDCYDHALQISELTDNYHSLGGQVLNFHLSIASHRQNEITKILTIIATIFIPLTFIAGVYGMNFNPTVSRWNMPELDWAYGYPTVMALMLFIGLALVVYFWRKGWIGRE
ncbi:MAG: magnesium/cobalt transporter CorA [Myxococcota bacterium]